MNQDSPVAPVRAKSNRSCTKHPPARNLCLFLRMVRRFPVREASLLENAWSRCLERIPQN